MSRRDMRKVISVPSPDWTVPLVRLYTIVVLILWSVSMISVKLSDIALTVSLNVSTTTPSFRFN